MDYEIITAIAKNILWLILLGWSVFRFLRYSEEKYPKPDSCSRKDYKSWREMEALPLQLAVVGTICSIAFTAFTHSMTGEAAFKIGAIRSAFWVAAAIAIPIIQSLAQGRAKKLRIF
jgi:hypothetical protein